MLASYPLCHDDYVLDLAFDFYGKRIATCSVDQKIKIWEKRQKSLLQSSGGVAAGLSPPNGQSSVMSEGLDGSQAMQTVFEWELVEEISLKAIYRRFVARAREHFKFGS